MGHETFYCFKCLTRLSSTDLEKGRALRIDNHVMCRDCLPPEEREAAPASARRGKTSSGRIPVVTSTPRAFRGPAPARKAGSGFWIAVGGAALLILIILVVALSGGSPPPPVPPPPAPRAVAPKAPLPPPAEDLRLKEARTAYETALKLQTARPEDFDALIAAFEEALRKSDRTSIHPEVLRDYDRLVARRREARAREEAEKPPPPTPGWRAVFDGRSTDFLLPATAGTWKVEGGALVSTSADPSLLPAKSKEEFGDVDVRIRFQFESASYLSLWVRQSGEGALGLEWDRGRLESLRGVPQEVVIRLRGDRGTLTHNGVTEAAQGRGKILKGPMQITAVGKGLRILAIEVREGVEPLPPAPWRAVFDGRSLDWMVNSSKPFWKIDGPGLVPNPEKSEVRDTIQTREAFADGDLRVVFEILGPVDSISLAVRQGGPGRIASKIDGARLRDLPPGRHEVLFSCRGPAVTAALDGAALPAAVEGKPDASGRLQFTWTGNGLRLLAVDWRPAW